MKPTSLQGGDAEVRPRRRQSASTPVRERLLEKALPEPNTGCWLWLGSHFPTTGYALLSVRNKARGAHRLAHEEFIGPIPAGAMVLHRCGNGHLGCINPAHLYAGDARQNAADAARHGSIPRGERHVNAKLKEDDVRAIRAASAAGRSLRSIAREYGVDRRGIQAITRRLKWKHVN